MLENIENCFAPFQPFVMGLLSNQFSKIGVLHALGCVCVIPLGGYNCHTWGPPIIPAVAASLGKLPPKSQKSAKIVKEHRTRLRICRLETSFSLDESEICCFEEFCV